MTYINEDDVEMRNEMKRKKLWIPTLMIGMFILLCVMVICYVKDYSHSEVTIQEYADKGQIDVIEISEGIFLDGLVLLAAYATESLKREGFCVLSIYGSEDGVLSMEKLKTAREWMPSDYIEICIEGGNHAWFGNYGEQKGDHKANISREDQQKQTVDTILSMVSHE